VPESCPPSGCTGDEKFFNSHDNHHQTTFVGSIGAESGGAPDTVETYVATSTGAGYATIKEDVDDTLDRLLFTSADPLEFSDFSFRGQIDPGAPSYVLTLIVTGCVNVLDTCVAQDPETIFLTADAAAPHDFSRLAIESPDETIFSVEVETAPGAFFKEFKQVDFSPAGLPPIPEPASWAMMILGFGGVGGVLRSRRRLSAATL
jgi:hypothetical protein